MSAPVIILQRVVPHYRMALFRRLYDRFGWQVACAANPPGDTGLSLQAGAQDFILPFDFSFPDAENPYRADVPVDAIIAQTQPCAVISEFSMHMSSSLDLVKRRLTGRGPKLAFWTHGWNMERGWTAPADIAAQLARVPLFMAADAVGCYSPEGAKFLRRFKRASRITVLHNTLDMARFQALADDYGDLREAGAGPHLLSIGRFTPDKRMPDLVAMMAGLRTRLPGVSLTLIGDGPDMAAVRTEAAKLPEGTVTLTGALYDEAEIARHMMAADAMVYAGAVGLAVNHALGYGLPVIAFGRVEGGPRHHPEIAWVMDGVTGYRVTRPGMEAMTQRIVSAFDGSSPRDRLARPLAEYVQRHLTLDRMVDDFAGLGRMLNVIDPR